MEGIDDGGKEYILDLYMDDLSTANTVLSSHDYSDDTVLSEFTFSLDEPAVSEWKPINKWKLQNTLLPIDEVLILIKKFKWVLMGKRPKVQQQEQQEEGRINERFMVKRMRPKEVLEKIDDFVCETVNSLIENGQFHFHIPPHKPVFDKASNRHITVPARSTTTPVNMASRKKAACYARILEVVHRSLDQGVPFSLSHLYYQDPIVFGHDRFKVPPLLDNICLKFGCNMESLNVVAAEKGLIKGNLEFEIGPRRYSCINEIMIPPNAGHIKISSVKTKANFILIIEKHSVYENIVSDAFEKRYDCIIITARGQPDLSTRMFLKILCSKAKIPVFALMDGDPYGFDIMSTYKFGSRSMAYDDLALKRIVWLGILPSDVETLGIPRNFMMQLSNTDVKRCRQILKYDYVKENDDYVAELELMIKLNLKIELDALSRFDMRYIPRFYLPFKLEQVVKQARARRDSGSFPEPVPKLRLELDAKPAGYNASDSDSNEVKAED